jgi:membrane protease YdiL (CAAX protease family)
MKSTMKQHPVASFFVIAYAMSWILWIPIVLYIRLVLPAGQDPGWLMLPMLIGLYTPTIAATIVTRIEEGKEGVKKLWSKFLVWRVGFQWWLAAFLLSPLAALAAIGIYVLQGGTVGQVDLSQWYMVLLGPVIALPFFVGEELGWRGYLLTKLQNKYSALWSSVIVGVIWVFWHTPAFWAPSGTALSGQPVTLFSVGWYLLLLIGVSILMTFVYNNSKGSLLLAVLFHGMFTGPNIFPLFPEILLDAEAESQIIKLVVIPVWVLAVLVIGRFGTAHLSRNNERIVPETMDEKLSIGWKF